MLRLRKVLKFTQHEMVQRKSLYVRRDVTAELVQKDVRYLHILIFRCEADWAFAMMLKQRSTQKSLKINTNRAKVHSLKRFKAASKTALHLLTESLDDLSQLEIEAYQQQMHAYLQLEQFNYKEALDMLLRAKFIYESILKVKDELDQAIYKEKCAQLDTFIRQCCGSIG